MIRTAVALVVIALASCALGCDGGTTSSTTDAGPLVVPDAYSSSDPYSAARLACISEINRLRATRGLPPYTAWTGVEACVDAQATADEAAHSAHMSWSMHAGVCDGNGQNECLGQGPDGIVACLDQMWAEREQPGCSGCDACADHYNSSCPNCDFFGTATGDVCGHYVNLSALYLTEAACGFSSAGGWDVINFR